MEKRSLVVMAKAPLKGEVKTRLIPWLGEERACEFYKCLLQDRLEEVYKLSQVDLYIACFPFERKSLIEELIPHSQRERIKIIPQKGRDLGERITSVLNSFDWEAESVLLIDTDTPLLTVKIIERGFSALQKFDLVIGPTQDGGYYLIGLKEKHFELFAGVPWGSNKVLLTTLEKARKKKLKVKILPTLLDIDEKKDALLFCSQEKKLSRTTSFLRSFLASKE